MPRGSSLPPHSRLAGQLQANGTADAPAPASDDRYAARLSSVACQCFSPFQAVKAASRASGDVGKGADYLTAQGLFTQNRSRLLLGPTSRMWSTPSSAKRERSVSSHINAALYLARTSRAGMESLGGIFPSQAVEQHRDLHGAKGFGGKALLQCLACRSHQGGVERPADPQGMQRRAPASLAS